MADIASDDPKRAIKNAIDRIRMTVNHSTTATTPGEARAFMESVSHSISSDLDTINQALEIALARAVTLETQYRALIDEQNRRIQERQDRDRGCG